MKKEIKHKKILIIAMGFLYLSAGINHFINPDFYLRLIPPFFTNPEFINILAGISELVLGLGIFFFQTRVWAAWGIVLMLIAFIPAHWYFIDLNTCTGSGICLAKWFGWIRLIIIQPVLIYWAYWVAKNPKFYG
jgi:uncharacterized membrane protein